MADDTALVALLERELMLPAKRCLSYKFMNADCVPVAYEMFKVCVRVCVCVCV